MIHGAPAPERDGGVDIGEMADLRRRALHEARIDRGEDGGDGDHAVDQARPEHGGDRKRQQDAGKGQQQVDEAHDDEADAPPK